MASVTAPRMGAIEWGLLLTLSVLWGGSYFFAKVALAMLQTDCQTPLAIWAIEGPCAATVISTIYCATASY